MNRLVLSVFFVLAVTAVGRPAWAQQGPAPRADRPYRGLFASGVDGAEQLLSVSAMLGGGFDGNTFANPFVLGLSDPELSNLGRAGGGYGFGTGGATYTLNKSRVTAGASIASSARYFAELDRLITAYSGSAGLSLDVVRWLSLSQDVTYQPWYSFAPFPSLFDPVRGEVPAFGLDLAVSRSAHINSVSSAQFQQQVGRRSAVIGTYAYRVSHFADEVDDLRTQSGMGRYTFDVARGLGLRLGYGYTQGHYPGGIVKAHTIDAGVDFNRALSLSRRTTLSFSSGTTAVTSASDRQDLTSERLHYRVTGQARLTREIARTWYASIAYDRNVNFAETFREPLFYDSVMVAFGGLITRRLQFRSAAGTSFGDVGVTGGNGFEGYSGAATLTQALSRHLAVGVELQYHRLRFDSARLLPQGLKPDMDLHSARAYITVWAPIFRRGGRPNASR